MRLTCACLTKPDSISDHELIPLQLLRVSMFTIKNYAARVLIPMSDVYVCDMFIRVSDFDCGSRCFPHFFRSLSGVFPESFRSLSPVLRFLHTSNYILLLLYILYTIYYIVSIIHYYYYILLLELEL